MTLHCSVLHFEFRAKDRIGFDEGKAGNTWRGGFGFALKKRFCGEKTLDAPCRCAPPCPYSRIFEPTWEGGPSGFQEPPRAFVIRAFNLDGRKFEPGEKFGFSLHLFSQDSDWRNAIQAAVGEAGAAGLGTTKARVEMTGIRAEDLSVPLHSKDNPPSRLVVEFLTPLEIKTEGRVIASPQFGLMFRRLRDRISSILSVYQNGSPECDFRALAELADKITSENVEWQQCNATRRSMRTGQKHSIGGQIGKYELSGDFSTILPWLEAGVFTGVGRQTAWGKGAYRLITK